MAIVLSGKAKQSPNLYVLEGAMVAKRSDTITIGSLCDPNGGRLVRVLDKFVFDDKHKAFGVYIQVMLRFKMKKITFNLLTLIAKLCCKIGIGVRILNTFSYAV